MAKLFNFSLLLLGVVSVVFALHLLVLNLLGFPLLDNQIIACYLFNLIVAKVIVILLSLLQHKVAESLGYIFMLGSLVKFGLFFIIFYPNFKADGDVSRIEFFSFFVPYAICLIVEVVFLSKTLNK